MEASKGRAGQPIVRNVDRQTLGFELPELPGQEFRIALPELLSDANHPILPWGFVSPKFEIRDNSACLVIELPDEVRVEARVHFGRDGIEADLTATNLSTHTWEKLNAFTCFACYKAGSFYDPELTRTYFPIEGNWKPLVELRPEHGPENSPYTFSPVARGPSLDELWVSRRLRGHETRRASQGCACVVSADEGWVAGVMTGKAAYLFNNQKLTCLHAAPLMGTVPPGGSSVGRCTIFIFRGTLEDFAAKCRSTLGEMGCQQA
jgi:hypothetical protein